MTDAIIYDDIIKKSKFDTENLWNFIKVISWEKPQISKDIQPLYDEAKKYKSADDMIKWLEKDWKVLYHWTNKEFNELDFNKAGSRDAWYFGKWIYFSDDVFEAETYWKNIKKAIVDKDANILDISNITSSDWPDRVQIMRIISDMKWVKEFNKKTSDIYNIISKVDKNIKDMWTVDIKWKNWYIVKYNEVEWRSTISKREAIDDLVWNVIKKETGESLPHWWHIIQEIFDWSFDKIAKNNWYGWVKWENETVIFDSSKIKTESQLRKIREEANKK